MCGWKPAKTCSGRDDLGTFRFPESNLGKASQHRGGVLQQSPPSSEPAWAGAIDKQFSREESKGPGGRAAARDFHDSSVTTVQLGTRYCGHQADRATVVTRLWGRVRIPFPSLL